MQAIAIILPRVQRHFTRERLFDSRPLNLSIILLSPILPSSS